MSTSPNTSRYSLPAIGLHWIMAWLILGVYFLGISLDDFPVGPDLIRAVTWHKWLGVTIGFLWFARVAWRFTHRPPALPGTPDWQHRAAHLMHFTLYILMIAIPVVGWLMSSAKGYTTTFFGLFDLPNLLDKDKPLAHTLHEVHEVLANVLIGLVVLHVAAALKHHLIDKDNLLNRMRPQRNKN